MQVVEWKCVVLVAGEQCVTKDGTDTMPTLHVDSWDSIQNKQSLSEVDTLVKEGPIGLSYCHELVVKEAKMYHNC